MDAADLFAGWGGMSLGAELAGARVVHAENHWERGVLVHQINHPGANHRTEDARGRDWRDLPPFGLLLAGPACQGHSSNGRPTRKRNPTVRERHDLERATAWAVVECVRQCEPEALVVENVVPFLGWAELPAWLGELGAAGLHVQCFKLWASHHGVPQRRQRVFFVGTRRPARLSLVERSLVERSLVERSLVERPLGSHPELAFGPCVDWGAGGWRPITSMSPGAQARIVRAKRNWGPVCLSQHVTAHPGLPLWQPIRTITTAHNHWVLVRGEEGRFLTPRELARAQSFPEAFTWPEDYTVEEVCRGLGNAVPPNLARDVVRAVLDAVG